MTRPKSPATAPIKPTSEIALQAKQRLHKALVRIGSDAAHYLRCLRTGSGRQLALNRVNAGIDVWTEPVWDNAPTRFQSMRKQRYPADKPRISSLGGNAPRLETGSVADYGRFPTLGDMDAFVDWYKTL